MNKMDLTLENAVKAIVLSDSDKSAPTTPQAVPKRLKAQYRKSMSTHLAEHRHDQYVHRMDELKLEIDKLQLSSLEISNEDLKDPFCDPDKPVKIQFNDVSAAAYRLRGGIENTPCQRSHMSDLYGMEIHFKKDFLQYTGSFKERGARYCLLHLSEKQKARGVIAASAGNHAQALCYHGKQLGIPVICVMPVIAPMMKVNNCKQYGAIVISYGQDLSESKAIAMKLGKMFDLMYINGYDHPDILAGQGTMALEIMEQVPHADAIIVPVGGGGLLAGIATAVKAMNPNILVIAAEPAHAPSFKNAMDNGRPLPTKIQSTLADGLAVSVVGVNSYASACKLVDKCVLVSEEFIAISILRLVELEKAVVEGAGACAFGAVLEGLLPELNGKRVVIPLCGGNIDTTVLGRVLERGLVADSRMIKVWVTISDRPGGLADLCKLFAEKKAGVKDLYHERAWLKSDMFSVQVQVVLEVRDEANAIEIEQELRKRYDNVVFGPYGTHHH